MLKTWDRHDVFVNSSFKYDFLPIEVLHGPKLLSVDEIKEIFKKMGVDFEEVRTAYEEELIEREVQEAEAIAEEEMEEEYEKNEENKE